MRAAKGVHRCLSYQCLALLFVSLLPAVRAYLGIPVKPSLGPRRLALHSSSVNSPAQPIGVCLSRQGPSNVLSGIHGAFFTGPVQLSKVRHRPILRMAAGGADGDKLAAAEKALDDAIANNDVNAINKWMKNIERLQGPSAGAAPYSKKKISKDEESAAIQELLGRLDNNVADDVADALTATALEDMAVAQEAAERALDEAVASNDGVAIASATRRLKEMQGAAAGDAAVDRAKLPGSDVERDLAEALEQAAIDEGYDVDDAGLLDDLPAADLATRVAAARAVLEDAVAANNAQALANAISVLGRLLGTAATSEALESSMDLRAVEAALRAVGILNVASAEAAAEIADALAAALAEEEEEEEEEEPSSGVEMLEAASDRSTAAAAAAALLDQSVAAGDEGAIEEVLEALRELDELAGGAGAEAALGAPSQAEVDAVMRKVTGRQVSEEEATAVAEALAAAAVAERGSAAPLLRALEGVQDTELRLQVADLALDEAVAAADADAAAAAMAVLAEERGRGGGEKGVGGLDAEAARAADAVAARWQVPGEAMEDVAAALAAAEMEEQERDVVSGSGAGETSTSGVGESSTKAALEELLEVLDEEEEGREEGGGEEEEDEEEWGEEEEVEEEEGVYLVGDDALVDDAAWRKNAATGWEEEEEVGEDEGRGVSWVEQAKALAEEEAVKLDCNIVDARWTNGKLLFKVEHVDPERHSVGVAECEKVARALGYRLDTSAFMQDKSYKLVVSTPGAKDVLTRDREFVAFKGFPVCVTTSEPLKKKDGPTKFEGTLYDRTEDTVVVNAKGRMIKIPRAKVSEVRLVQDQVKLR